MPGSKFEVSDNLEYLSGLNSYHEYFTLPALVGLR